MQKEAIILYFKLLSKHFIRGTEEYHGKILSQNRGFIDWESNVGLWKYKAEIPTTTLQHSIT
jgi:hypothetical protein